MALAEADRKDGLIMLVVFDFFAVAFQQLLWMHSLV